MNAPRPGPAPARPFGRLLNRLQGGSGGEAPGAAKYLMMIMQTMSMLMIMIIHTMIMIIRVRSLRLT